MFAIPDVVARYTATHAIWIMLFDFFSVAVLVSFAKETVLRNVLAEIGLCAYRNATSLGLEHYSDISSLQAPEQTDISAVITREVPF